MAWKKPTQLTAWSYSRFGTYQQCPLKAKLSYIDKIEQPKNDAMIRGAAIHELAEKYLKGQIRTYPKELNVVFKDDFNAIKKLAKAKPAQVTIEDTWALRKDWSETVWNDWDGVWVRIKLDVAHVEKLPDGTPRVVVTDYKTGKFRPQNQNDYLQQMELYATGALIKYQEVLGGVPFTVAPRLVYLDAGVVYPRVPEEGRIYSVPDLKGLKKDWEKRVKPMLNDKTFAPKPNSLCGWCSYRKDNGGPCKY